MIIPCKQCHTRFKVPDRKITARWLKVRCSRCGHTFRIFPDSGADQGADPAPAAARPKGPDPFEAFGPDGASEMEKTPERGTAVSALLAKMEPSQGEDDFDVDVAGVDPASTEPAWNFPPAPVRPGAAGAAAVAWELETPEAPSAGAFAA
ncbi:MAG TPA: zinc-ribbon domain-containing protein, partial [Solirubrobacteraceae bacterium]